MRASFWKLLIGFAVLALLVALLSRAELDGLDWRRVAIGALLAQPCILFGNLVQAWRHRLLVGSAQLPFPVALRAVILAAGLNLVLPARMSELLKVTYVTRHTGLDGTLVFSALVAERMSDIVFVLLLVAALPASLLPSGDWLVPALVVAGAFLLVVFHRRIAGVLTRLPDGRIRNALLSFAGHYAARMRSPRFPVAVLLGIVALGGGLAAFHLFLDHALDGALPLTGSLAVFLGGILGGTVAVLPGAVGSYHAATALVLAAYGVPAGEALALSVVLHLLQYMLFLPLALAIAAFQPTGLKEALAAARGMLRRPADPASRQ
ncbi:lysylphosphatidylglycerol synthase transmembrane domain-containing protein [Oceanibacterium hippocampi]|uniref:Flippase-like domain-containing protein n=1 Tax=Oceanibacterium hippocampi TaxID=745714 RepID=A0A1Y5S0J1_9PROT|nr:lysylphosphatidylglycerol synthase transmembrane domain-containing protein [Oceanibacterium hippocampi]SLN29683.1 hypothetical protein OCH7691_01024 [Oceanibacterium hippocampi]